MRPRLRPSWLARLTARWPYQQHHHYSKPAASSYSHIEVDAFFRHGKPKVTIDGVVKTDASGDSAAAGNVEGKGEAEKEDGKSAEASGSASGFSCSGSGCQADVDIDVDLGGGGHHNNH